MGQLSKLKLITSTTSIEKIENTNVLLIGLGGVGGHAFEGLIRSGILNITVVDGDKFEETNLNRQLLSLHSTIGKYKTDVAQERALDINKNVKIKKVTQFLTPKDLEGLELYKYDYVIDACDTVSVKKELIRICTKKNIKLISCMGTGNKMKPEMLEITDIRKTSYDPLAKILRKMVKDEKIKAKIPVVSSREVPIKTNTSEIGTNSYIPTIAGLLLVSYVINDIIGVK